MDRFFSLVIFDFRRLAYSTGSTSTQPAGHAGWGDADFSLVGHNDGELKASWSESFDCEEDENDIKMVSSDFWSVARFQNTQFD